jgi:hypothetical protein
VLRLTAHIRIGLLPDKGQSSLHRRNQPFLICCAAATGYVAQHFFNAIARLAIQRTVRVPSYYTHLQFVADRTSFAHLEQRWNITPKINQASINKGLCGNQRSLPPRASAVG